MARPCVNLIVDVRWRAVSHISTDIYESRAQHQLARGSPTNSKKRNCASRGSASATGRRVPGVSASNRKARRRLGEPRNAAEKTRVAAAAANGDGGGARGERARAAGNGHGPCAAAGALREAQELELRLGDDNTLQCKQIYELGGNMNQANVVRRKPDSTCCACAWRTT